MPNYDFKKDLPIAEQTEKEVAKKLFEYYGWKTIYFCKSNNYDLLVQGKSKLMKIEIKEDFSCARTGNVGVEFECRGKPSGISVTFAEMYIYKIHKQDGTIEYRSIATEKLKEAIRDVKYFRIVYGGDPGSRSGNYLFTYDKLCLFSKLLFDEIPLNKIWNK